MKIQTQREEYLLDAESIDLVSEKLDIYLETIRTEPSNILRIRLSVEEALLRFQDHFGDGVRFRTFFGSRLGHPVFSIELPGELFNPLDDTDVEFSEWSSNLLSNIGLIPSYGYQSGVNVIQLKFQKPRSNPAFIMLISIAVGALIGILGRVLLPETLRAMILFTVLEPIQEAFFNILNAASGPVIFLSVITAICGVGSAAAVGQSGKRLLVRFILLSSGAALIAAAVAGILSGIVFQGNIPISSQFSSLLDLFTGLVPADLFSPLIQGNSPQLVLLAIVLGNALLLAGTQAGRIVTIIEQLDNIGLIVADWVSRIAPFFISLLLIFGILRGSLDILFGIWKPLLIVIALSGLFLFVRLLYISRRKEVPLKLLFRKVRKPFFIALKTASVDAAYGAARQSCERSLGIRKQLAQYGLPLGLVSYMPMSTVAVIVFLVYTAGVYDIPITIVWGVTAVVLTVVLIAATPPVAGVGLLTYTALFARLNIPTEALTAAIIADILFAFLCSACNLTMLQMELLLEADKIGFLDREALQKEE